MKSSLASLSTITKVSLRILGEMIKCARLERRMSQKDLAERLNRSRYTVMAIEKGDPEVAIGVVFEAATIVGVRLLGDDTKSIQKLSNTVSHLMTVLPKKAKKSKKEIDDDF
jgi:transcriptional regulator with XRE-family HTH domain